jgi:hypothetical protein
MLVLPPLLGHLPDCLESVGRRRLAPKRAIEVNCRRGRHEALGPLGSTLSCPLLAGHC